MSAYLVNLQAKTDPVVMTPVLFSDPWTRCPDATLSNRFFWSPGHDKQHIVFCLGPELCSDCRRNLSPVERQHLAIRNPSRRVEAA